RHFQLISADALVTRALAFCASKIEVLHVELGSAIQAPVSPRTEFHLQLQTIETSFTRQHFNAKLQGIGIDSGQLANPQTNSLRRGSRMASRLHLTRLKYGLSYAQLVHKLFGSSLCW